MKEKTTTSDSRFHVGDVIKFNEKKYVITGRIKYKDKKNNQWDEYKISLRGEMHATEWLSIDEDECILWELCSKITDIDNGDWELLEEGKETVIAAFQKVDVTPSDEASFWEYENKKTQEYYSIEEWDDETEYCRGKKIDLDSIKLVKKGTGEKEIKDDSIYLYLCIIIAILAFYFITPDTHKIPTIEESLDKSSNFTSVSYITGIETSSGKYAYVYKCTDPMQNADSIARFIITQREGEVETVLKHEDSEIISILTDKEFCFIYPCPETEEGESTKSEEERLIELIRKDTGTKYSYVFSATREWMLANWEEPLYQADSTAQSFYIESYESTSFEADSTRTPSVGNQHRRHYFSSHRGNRDIFIPFIQDIRESSRLRRRSSGGHRGGGK